jgi:hypothetical protein
MLTRTACLSALWGKICEDITTGRASWNFCGKYKEMCRHFRTTGSRSKHGEHFIRTAKAENQTRSYKKNHEMEVIS